MNCLRCGKETTEEQVFCDLCLSEMEAQPVKPGTPVYIPRRPTEDPRKASRRREATTEKKLSWTQKLNHCLILITALLLIIICVLSVFLHDALHPKVEEPPKGRNYTYVGDIPGR